MQSSLRKGLFLFCILFFLTFGAAQGLAAESLTVDRLLGSSLGETTGLGQNNLLSTLGLVIRVFLSILGVVAVVIILLGGFRWMTAGGDTEKVASAKRLLIQGIIGFLLIIGAYSITHFVFSSILSATNSDGSSSSSSNTSSRNSLSSSEGTGESSDGGSSDDSSSNNSSSGSLPSTSGSDSSPDEEDTAETTSPVSSYGPQIGLNFIRFFWDSDGADAEDRLRGETTLDTYTDYVQPEAIFQDFSALGIDAYRQLAKADLTWSIIEPRDNEWNFTATDEVFLDNPGFEPVVTLFLIQYASPTPHWATDPSQFQKTLGPEAEDYLDHVISRYGSVVTYWEIGNEMDHWRSEDPENTTSVDTDNQAPNYSPTDGFSPQEQGVFLAEVAAYIRARDADAIIVMPGMGDMSYGSETWLPGVLEGAGGNIFDVVNYHSYGAWQRYSNERVAFGEKIGEYGLGDLPIWLTETGSSSSPEVTTRTNYPNSDESQAADVFRRIISAYGHGDSYVGWHTYIGSPVTEGNSWGAYGISDEYGVRKPSFDALQLLIEQLLPFESVTDLSEGSQYIYKIVTQSGEIKYVVWGTGTYIVPSEITSSIVVTEPTWQTVIPNQSLTLTTIPLLLR